MRPSGSTRLIAAIGLATLLASFGGSVARANSEDDPFRAHILPALDGGPTDPLPPAGAFSLSVPIYHSFPSAAVKLYIDFDGDTTSNWGGYSPGTTPAYSIDADTSTFSQQELDNIQQIWMRVSEAYSPFNIDVTTEQPADQSTKHYYRVVVGGDGKNGQTNYWYSGDSITRAGGISFIGGFANSNLPNSAYVFPGNLGNGTPKYTAEAVAHEAGHGFGLYHQSTYDASGAKTAEYNPGTPDKAPFMGVSYHSTRAMWWQGTSLSAQTIQNDLDGISSFVNNFGYRPADHAMSLATAQPLTMDSSTSGHASGVLRMTGEGAYYSFDLDQSYQVTIDVTGAQYGQMLSPSLMLFQGGGIYQFISHADALQEEFSGLLPKGMYDVAVFGNGDYGDIGQYFLTASFAAAVPEPAFSIGIAAGLLLLVGRRHGASARPNCPKRAEIAHISSPRA